MCEMLVLTYWPNLMHLKKVFVYEIRLIAIREVSPSFDEEQQYGGPYQPKHIPSSQARTPQHRQSAACIVITTSVCLLHYIT